MHDTRTRDTAAIGCLALAILTPLLGCALALGVIWLVRR